MLRLIYLCMTLLLLLTSAVVAQDDEPTETPIFVTATPFPEDYNPTPTITPEGFVASPTAVPVDPLSGGDTPPPPINIDLPEDWFYGYESFVFNDLGELRIVPFALYTGPVEGGQGYILVLWGFTSVATGNPFAGGLNVSMYVDGLRLMRLVLLEQGCNIGTDIQQDYTIGGLPAEGTQFSAVNCPTTADTAGWFAGLQVEGVNFVFYAFVEPIEALDNGIALGQMETILDSVTFDIDSFINPEITAEPEITVEPEVTATP